MMDDKGFFHEVLAWDQSDAVEPQVNGEDVKTQEHRDIAMHTAVGICRP